MPPLQFQIDLRGNFAAHLVPVNQGLAQTGENLRKDRKELELFEAEVGNLKGSIGGLSINLSGKGGSFFGFDLAEGIKQAVGAVRAMVGALVDLGKEIVTTAGVAQDLDLAIRLNVNNDNQKAEAIRALAASIEFNTRLDHRFVAQALLPLLEQGVTDVTLLDDLVTASGDIATRRRTGQAGATAALTAFQKIALKGEVDPESMASLAINQNAYFKNLGGLLGVSEKRAKDLVKEGKVKSQTLLSVALDEVAKRQGGALGIAVLEGGQTLGATLERLSNLKGNLLEELAHTEGIKRFQEVLDNFIATMSGPEGKKLMAEIGEGIAEVSRSVFGFLTGPNGLREMVATFKSVIGFMREAWYVFRGIVEQTVGGVQLVWNVVKAAAGLGYISKLQGNDLDANIKSALVTIGRGGASQKFAGNTEVVSGLRVSIGQLGEAGAEGGKAIGDGMKAGLDQSLDAHSPSREMIARGRNAGDSFAMGVDGSSEAVGAATRRSVADTVLGGSEIRGAGAGAAGGFVFNEGAVQVIIETSGDAAAIGDSARRGVRQAMHELLEELQAGLGMTEAA